MMVRQAGWLGLSVSCAAGAWVGSGMWVFAVLARWEPLSDGLFLVGGVLCSSLTATAFGFLARGRGTGLLASALSATVSLGLGWLIFRSTERLVGTAGALIPPVLAWVGAALVARKGNPKR